MKIQHSTPQKPRNKLQSGVTPSRAYLETSRQVLVRMSTSQPSIRVPQLRRASLELAREVRTEFLSLHEKQERESEPLASTVVAVRVGNPASQSTRAPRNQEKISKYQNYNSRSAYTHLSRLERVTRTRASTSNFHSSTNLNVP